MPESPAAQKSCSEKWRATSTEVVPLEMDGIVIVLDDFSFGQRGFQHWANCGAGQTGPPLHTLLLRRTSHLPINGCLA
jgi:hypothetical protein